MGLGLSSVTSAASAASNSRSDGRRVSCGAGLLSAAVVVVAPGERSVSDMLIAASAICANKDPASPSALAFRASRRFLAIAQAD